MIEEKMITIRAYNDQDLDAVLALIKKSDSTDRTDETWVGNDMTAMLAFEEGRLIGIIPFEKRRIVLNEQTKINALWVSAAHVEPDYRSQGIGTRLDNTIKDEFFPEFEAVFVIREDEQSPAYRWYQRLGYHYLSKILSLKLDVQPMKNSVEYTLMEISEDFENNGVQLMRCFDKNIMACGGFPERDEGFWLRKWNVHYYRDHYAFKIIVIQGKENLAIEAYAFVGQTSLRDGIDRLDILEIIVPKDDRIRKRLIHAILGYANQIDCKELRIQLAENDPLVSWFKNFGFVFRWQTNLLGKYIDTEEPFHDVHWKFFQIDYI